MQNVGSVTSATRLGRSEIGHLGIPNPRRSTIDRVEIELSWSTGLLVWEIDRKLLGETALKKGWNNLSKDVQDALKVVGIDYTPEPELQPLEEILKAHLEAGSGGN